MADYNNIFKRRKYKLLLAVVLFSLAPSVPYFSCAEIGGCNLQFAPGSFASIISVILLPIIAFNLVISIIFSQKFHNPYTELYSNVVAIGVFINIFIAYFLSWAIFFFSKKSHYSKKVFLVIVIITVFAYLIGYYILTSHLSSFYNNHFTRIEISR